MDHEEKLVINRMTTRRDRHSRALEPSHVLLDERSLPDLLSFAPKVARQIHYYDLDNRPNGTFEAFFLHDPVMVLVSIVALPLQRIENELVMLERDSRAEMLDRRKPDMPYVRELVQLIEVWRRHIGSEHSDKRAEVARAAIDAEIQSLYRELLPLWDHFTGSGAFCGRIRVGDLVQAIEALQSTGRSYLNAFLDSGGHKPHLALYIAFAKLLQKARGSINAISSRYIDFYYRDVLREPARDAVSDNVYLTFTSAKGVASATVPAGSRFSAGKDTQGADIVFASQLALRVSAARMAPLRSIRVVPEPFFQNAVPRCVQTTEDTQQPRPTTLGLAIASPYLALAGGQRTLRICIRCPVEIMKALCTRLQPLAIAVGADIPDVLKTALEQAFTLSLSRSEPAGWFDVEYTVRVATNLLDHPQFELEIVLPHDAPPVAPNRDAHGPAPDVPTLKMVLNQHPISWSKEGVSTYPLSVLADLEVQTIWLETEVSGLSDVTLSNPGGVLDTKKPFFIFGGAPSLGAYLDIHHPEVFAKRIHKLSVTIDWFGLPASARGFAGYYEDYHLGVDGPVDGRVDGSDKKLLFDNKSFKASFRIVNPSASSVGEDPSSVYLFCTTVSKDPNVPEPAGELVATSHFDVSAVVPAARPAHYDPSQRALRLGLVAPREAFGDVVYPQNVLAAAMPEPHKVESEKQEEEGRSQEREATIPEPPKVESKPQKRRMPNVPWTPRAERLALSYSTECLIAGETPPASENVEQSGTAFYLLPFDGFRPWEKKDKHELLAPADDRSDSLLLGFANASPPELLTLLFHIATAEDTGSDSRYAITWERLTGNDWTPTKVRFDETRDLRRTGTLVLPLAASNGTKSTVLPADHDWVRARVDNGSKHFPPILGIHPNAVLCSWQKNGNTGEHLGQPRPAGSIKTSLDKLANIANIEQPIASFGGIPPETAETMPIRLGERIRHKERAIVGWDYERLVLDRFPEIDKVCVLPARGMGHGQAPGHMTIVVLPGADGYKGSDNTTPIVDPDMLQAIHESIIQVTSPFVQLHVVNPVYVRITVHAEVEFVPNEDPGACIERLNDELIQALSPWSLDTPWATVGNGIPTEDDIAEWIRIRPYVNAVFDVSFQYSPGREDLDWYFLTTATKHAIKNRRDDANG